MNLKSVVSEFPNSGTINSIHDLPKATHDVTRFIKLSPEQIVEDLNGQGASLNIVNADPSEIAKFEQVNALLREQGQPEIKMFGKEIETEITEINHEILEAVLDRARGAFKAFFAKVDAAALVDEYNTYIAPRQKAFDDIHSWGNIGSADVNDPIRHRVVALLDEVVKEHTDMLQKEVLPQFTDNPALQGADVSRAILLSMLSNFVRGVFYQHQNPQKVGGLRKLSVETLNEVGEDGFGTRLLTSIKRIMGR